MEYVKINDPDIPKTQKLTLDVFLSKMYDGVFKGFNLIFGNVFDQYDPDTKVTKNGVLRWYKNINPEGKQAFESAHTLPTNKPHGISNGIMNNWAKVINGRYEFFHAFLRAEKKIKGVPACELQDFMHDFADELYTVMQNDQHQPWYVI